MDGMLCACVLTLCTFIFPQALTIMVNMLGYGLPLPLCLSKSLEAHQVAVLAYISPILMISTVVVYTVAWVHDTPPTDTHTHTHTNTHIHACTHTHTRTHTHTHTHIYYHYICLKVCISTRSLMLIFAELVLSGFLVSGLHSKASLFSSSLSINTWQMPALYWSVVPTWIQNWWVRYSVDPS